MYTYGFKKILFFTVQTLPERLGSPIHFISCMSFQHQMGNESSIAERECGFFPYEHCGFGDRNCCAQDKQWREKLTSVKAKPAFSHIVHTFDNKQSEGNNSRIWVEPATVPAVPVVPLGPDFGNHFRQHSSSSSSGISSTHIRVPRSATFAESLPNPKELPQNIVAAAWV